MKKLMGVDIGTTGSKATVFNEKGEILVQAYREYPIEEYTGRIDPALVWTCVTETIQECTEKESEIEGICTTSFGESVVLIDKEQETLGESILYTTSGVEKEWKQLEAFVGAENIYRITGHVSHPMYTINRIMWYKKKYPELYRKTEKFLFFSSFVNMRLTGICAAEDTQAARSMVYDISKKDWSREILSAAGVAFEKLPICVAPGKILGEVKKDISEKLGFSKKPVVIAGGHDQPCVALGAGAVNGGDSVYGLGTVECLSLVLADRRQTKDMEKNKYVCAPHVVEGKYLTYGVLYSGGNVLKDLRNHLYATEFLKAKKGERNAYDCMFEELPQDTDLFFLPHTYGKGTPYMDLTATGVMVGLTPNTKRGEVVLAGLRGLAFDMRENIECLYKCGLEISKIRVAGGGAKSKIAMQIRANALNRELYVGKNIQAGTRGTFLLAAKGLGWICDFEKEIKNYIGEENLIIPEASEKDKYDALYEKYQKLKICL